MWLLNYSDERPFKKYQISRQNIQMTELLPSCKNSSFSYLEISFFQRRRCRLPWRNSHKNTTKIFLAKFKKNTGALSFWREKSRFTVYCRHFFLFTFLEFFRDWNWAERTGPPKVLLLRGGGAEQIGLSTAGAQVPTCSWDCGYNWEEKPACDKPASQPKISAKKWSANQSPQPIKKKPHSKKY